LHYSYELLRSRAGDYSEIRDTKAKKYEATYKESTRGRSIAPRNYGGTYGGLFGLFAAGLFISPSAPLTV